MPIAHTIAERHRVEPTDRSMPPVMMTAVMPSAMMATNAKLRVTLNRFCGVAKVSVMRVRTRQNAAAATITQNAWRATIRAKRPCASAGNSAVEAKCADLRCPPAIGSNRPLGNFDRSRDESRDFFGRRLGDRFVRHLAPAAQDDDAIRHRKN